MTTRWIERAINNLTELIDLRVVREDHSIEIRRRDCRDTSKNSREWWKKPISLSRKRDMNKKREIDSMLKKRDLDPRMKLKTMAGIENRTLLTKDHIHLWEIPVEINRRKLFNLQNDDI